MSDVLVIGGGPGGSVCARDLAREGFEVKLLERDSPERYKACAGGIPPRVDTITPMQPELVEREIDGGLLVSPDATQALIQAPNATGHIVFRSAYDEHLRQLAREAGAQVVHEATATHIELQPHGVSVRVKTPSGERTHQARCLVGAFGISPGHGLLRQLGLRRPPCILSVMMEVKLEQSAVDERIGNAIETYLDSRITPTGSAWIYPKRAGAAVGIISRTKSSGTSFKAKLHRFMTEHPVAGPKLAGWSPYFGDRKSSYFGHLIPREPLTRSFGDRFVLLGDAAGAADPLTGEGIYHAQLTGQLAARVLAENLRADRLSATTLQEYERRWKGQLHYPANKPMDRAARVMYEYPYYDRLMNALVRATRGNRRAGEAMQWAFTGERPLSEASLRLALSTLPLEVTWRLGWRSLALLPPLVRNLILDRLTG